MVTFLQWAAKDAVKRFTWLCGREQVLVDETIWRIKRLTGVPEGSREYLDGSQEPAQVIWDRIYQQSLEPTGRRLVVVRNAQEINGWSRLKLLVSTSPDLYNSHFVFVSTAPHPHLIRDGNFVLDENKKKQLIEPLVIFGDRRHIFDLVQCGELSTEPRRDNRGKKIKSSDFVQWIQGQTLVDESSAEHLIQRAAGDMMSIRNVVLKCTILGIPLERKTIDLLCEESSSDFAHHVLVGEKHKALLALRSMDSLDYSRTIGHLDQRLDVMETLHRANRNNRTVRDIISQDNIPGFVVKQLLRYAKLYDSAKVLHCRELLASMDELHRNGVKEFFDVLVALW